MGLRAIIGAALLLGSSSVVAFAACRGTTPDAPQAPSPSASDPTPSPPVATTSAPPRASGPNPAERLAAAVAAARTCEAPKAEITNRPDGGVVFNNAMTSADAGSIDRGQAVIDALGKETDAFRCCFDAGMPNQRDAEEKVMLTLELAPDGSVKTANVDAKRSTLKHEVALACLTAVAGDVDYPSSPSDQPTVVEYPLVARVGSADKQSSKSK